MAGSHIRGDHDKGTLDLVVETFDAKMHLADLLDKVAQGAVITITRRGVPVAKLAPLGTKKTIRPASALCAELRSFREAHPLSGVTTRELIDERRRQ